MSHNLIKIPHIQQNNPILNTFSLYIDQTRLGRPSHQCLAVVSSDEVAPGWFSEPAKLLKIKLTNFMC
jgi:hypothetical protein